MMKATHTRKLRAIRSHKYGTRHLVAGDEYEAPIRQAVALVVSRRARFADKPSTKRTIVAPVAPIVERTIVERAAASDQPESPLTIDQLRLEATRLGINIDGRWGIARLQHEIEQARGR
jgi:hypothetical protein